MQILIPSYDHDYPQSQVFGKFLITYRITAPMAPELILHIIATTFSPCSNHVTPSNSPLK